MTVTSHPPPHLQTAGKMFEGSPDVMLASIRRIMDLPSNCLLYPGDASMCSLSYQLRRLKMSLTQQVTSMHGVM